MRLLDLCAGIGGFRTAAESVTKDLEVVSVELDVYARKTYTAMYGDEVAFDDILSISRRKDSEDLPAFPLEKKEAHRIKKILGAVDVVTAGLPCQPHSLMGNRKGGTDARGELFWDVAAILEAIRPPKVVLENVRAIASVNGGEYFRALLGRMGGLGYQTSVWTLDAQEYGVPQVRRRTFVVASSDELPSSLPPSQPERKWATTWHLLERDVDEKYFLSERILGTILKDQHKGYRRPALINRLTARPLTRTMHKMHRASQDNYYSEAFIHGAYDESTGQVVPASSERGRIRRITPREAFRIQGFPEKLIDRALGCGTSDTQLYMLAGNAVPPPLAGAVLRHLLLGGVLDANTGGVSGDPSAGTSGGLAVA